MWRGKPSSLQRTPQLIAISAAQRSPLPRSALMLHSSHQYQSAVLGAHFSPKTHYFGVVLKLIAVS